MKKIIIMLAAVMALASCSSTGQGAITGTWIGGAIGSAIGGLSGGPRGSDIGTLVGMATGAAAGAAVGSEAQRQSMGYTRAASSQSDYAYNDEGYGSSQGSSYGAAVYDDVVQIEPSGVQQSTLTTGETLQSTVSAIDEVVYPISITNVRFINDAGTEHISKGELVKISFEIRNVSDATLTQIVPAVAETTGNSRLHISPSVLVESLEAKKAIRYTAYVSAQTNLKTGTAHFVISVNVDGTLVSNKVEFDIPLN